MEEKMSEEILKPELDPTKMWLQFYDSFAKSWSEALSEAVSSKAFADSMAQQLEGNLEAMGLLRRQVGEIMEQYLQQMSLPTRKEVLSLAERLTQIEMRLDDVDARTEEILDLLQEIRGTLPSDQ
jgi:hypothetical protein